MIERNEKDKMAEELQVHSSPPSRRDIGNVAQLISLYR